MNNHFFTAMKYIFIFLLVTFHPNNVFKTFINIQHISLSDKIRYIILVSNFRFSLASGQKIFL